MPHLRATRSIRLTPRITAVLVASTCAFGTRALLTPGEATVTAEQILDRHVEATGGRKAYEKVKCRVSRGTMLQGSVDVLGLFTLYETDSTDRLELFQSEQIGELRDGSRGADAWASSLMTGPRLKRGDERDYELGQASLLSEPDWREFTDSVERVGTREVDGRRLHEVRWTPREGLPETRLFDDETGLMVSKELTVFMEGAPMPGAIYYEDYRQVDGLLLPHRIRETQAGIEELVITIDQIEHRPSIPSSVFEPPVEVRALLDR